MIAITVGTFLVSNAQSTKKVYWGFWMFSIANASMLLVAADKMVLGLLLQLPFFMYTSTRGVILNGDDSQKNRDKIISLVLVVVPIVVLLNLNDFSTNTFSFKLLTDGAVGILAAAISVIGAFMLAYQNMVLRARAFVFYMAANVLYLYVAYQAHMNFFLAQTVFSLIMAYRGYKISMKAAQKDLLAGS